MQKIRAIIFDNDGTIADTYDTILKSFKRATIVVLGKEFPEEVLMAKVGIPLVDQMKDFSDDPEVQRRLVEVYRGDDEANHDYRVKIFDGELEALERLRSAGFRMSMATSKRYGLAMRGLDAIGVTPFFETLVGCEDTERHKPYPDPVLAAAEKMGVAIEDCAYVGDAIFDIQAAHAAGCVSVAVTWGMFKEEVLAAEGPDFIAHDFEELTDFLISIKA